MKKSLVAAALTAALAPAAFAQTNVTLYGIADAGVSLDSGGGGQSYGLRVNSGYMSSSRFGVTGTEDLGAGLKGVFTLELGYGIDTGEFRQSGVFGSPSSTSPQGFSTSAGFNRRAFVGLQGGFGTIALGRDYTPLFWAGLATDTLGYGLYGNNLDQTFLVGSFTGPNGTFSGNTSEQIHRYNNGLFYTSPKFGGLTLRAALSAGQERFAEPRRAGRAASIGADFGAGPLTVAAAFQMVALPIIGGTAAAPTFTGDHNWRRDALIGAKYNFGLFSLGGGYAQVDPSGDDNRNRQAWVGGSIGLGRGSLLAQVKRMEFERTGGLDEARTNVFSVAYTHPFSRRTTGYLSWGRANNKNGAITSLVASDNAVSAGSTGADPRGLAIGVRHAF